MHLDELAMPMPAEATWCRQRPSSRTSSYSTVSQLTKINSSLPAQCQTWRSHSQHSCRARPKPGHTLTLKLQMRTTSCSLRTPTHISASERHGYARACLGCESLGSFTKSQTSTHPAPERSPTCVTCRYVSAGVGRPRQRRVAHARCGPYPPCPAVHVGIPSCGSAVTPLLSIRCPAELMLGDDSMLPKRARSIGCAAAQHTAARRERA